MEREHTYVWLSENGLKTITDIPYTTKFKGINWTSNINKELPIKMPNDGTFGSEPATTLGKEFLKRVLQYPDRTCMQSIKSNLSDMNNSVSLLTYTWKNYFEMAMAFAKALVSLGVPERSTILIQGDNTPEHMAAMMGTILANCVFSDIYPTNSAEMCMYQAIHSNAVVIVCDNYKRLKTKFIVNQKDMPGVKAFILFSEGLASTSQSYKNEPPIYNWWQTLHQLGQEVGNRVIFNRIDNQRPGQCCNLVYTSGTTSKPKAVMLSHDNMTWTWVSYNNKKYKEELVDEQMIQKPIRIVSFLPLSHITAQMADFSRSLISKRPIEITFAPQQSLALNLLHETLKVVQPTELVAVPRVYEKFEDYVKLQIRMKWTQNFQNLVSWARAKGTENTKAQMNGDIAPFGYNLSRLLVLESIKKELGLQEVEQMFFGAAPLKNETQDFFTSLSMPIVNLYGLSETAAQVTLHEFPNAKLSTCGKPLPGTQIKIFNPNEQGVGEICVKGRNVFMGYLNNDKVTWDSFDSEGFFHTGDSGYLEEVDGNLVLSGRIKELIITSGGENVAPNPIEMTIKDLCPIVSNCIVVGDKQRYLTALLTLRVASSRKTGLPTNNLAPEVVLYLVSKLNSTSKTVQEACQDKKVLDYVQSCIDKANSTAINRVHEVKRWTILDRDFSVDSGELTPTMKVKRNFVYKMFEKQIDELYQQPKL